MQPGIAAKSSRRRRASVARRGAENRFAILVRSGGLLGEPLVELIGFEPTTPCLQSRCSPN